MKKLTSKSTFFNKKIFPTIWFGFLAVFVITSQFAGAGGENSSGAIFVIMPFFMALFGYFIMKKLVFDLIDEVYDEGDTPLWQDSCHYLKFNQLGR